MDEPYEEDRIIRILDDEISEKTKELLACLKEKDRDIFMKLYVDEVPMEEISREFHLDKSVLYSRISRAKKRIRNWRNQKE